MRKIYFILFLVFISCNENSNSDQQKESTSWFHLEGEAQGTTFSIKYEDQSGRDFSKEVKEIFSEMDNQLSSYVDSSLISRINNSNRNFQDNCTCDYFKSVFELSKTIHITSEGAFNPLVFPLVEYWGFGKKAETPDEINNDKINDFLNYMNFDSVSYKFDEATLEISRNPKIKFDFFGIAQGYTVDIIAEFLETKGIKNYMIEVGGEVRAKGRNERKHIWNLGIEKPTDLNAERALQATIKLNNRSMATSGNYRKFYEKDGIRYSHTIDPKTGYPVNHTLLSATILAPDCATADAYATVFMVLGFERGKQFLNDHPELKLDAYLIYSDEKGKFKTWTSKGIKEMIKESN